MYAQTRSFIVPQNLAGASLMKGIVATVETSVYSLPDLKSHVLGKLNTGDQLSSSASNQGWCQVKLLLQGNRITTGWMPARALTLENIPAQQLQRAIIEPSVALKSIRPPQVNKLPVRDQGMASSLSLGFVPIYDLKRYGESQRGLMIEYQKRTQSFFWGLPLTASQGKSFKVMSGGVSLGLDILKSTHASVFLKPEFLGEYLLGGSKRVLALSVGFAWGLRYQLSKQFGLGLEPYSVIGMVWNNQEILWNLRSRSALYAFYSF